MALIPVRIHTLYYIENYVKYNYNKSYE